MTKLQIGLTSFIYIFLSESSKHQKKIQFSFPSLFFFYFLLLFSLSEENNNLFFSSINRESRRTSSDAFLFAFQTTLSILPKQLLLEPRFVVAYNLGIRIYAFLSGCVQRCSDKQNLNQSSLIRLQCLFGCKMTFKLN